MRFMMLSLLIGCAAVTLVGNRMQHLGHQPNFPANKIEPLKVVPMMCRTRAIGSAYLSAATNLGRH